MKYLLVLAVIAFGVWMFATRARKRGHDDAQDKRSTRAAPHAMARCARCGLHLPAADAVIDGASVYCSEAHRRLGHDRAPDR